MRSLTRVFLVIALLLVVVAFGPVRPDVPDSLKAPEAEDVVLSAHATGVQIYVCKAEKGEKPAWAFEAPEADLSNPNGKVIIHHSAGPTWKHIDGSQVVGKVIAKQDSPKATAIPWLLLSATHTGDGTLGRVTTIQRINTEGGLPPNASECDAAANGKESTSFYTADYYFYAPAQK